jgi:cell division protein FtsB
VRYWGNEQRVAARQRPPAERHRAGARRSVAYGGSVKPFLRRFYDHQAGLGRPVQRVVLFLIVAGLLYAFVLGDGGAIGIALLRAQRADADREIEMMRRSIAALETEIARLESDPFYIEKTGRERYGYVHPDETVYRIVEPAPADRR